MLEKILKGTIFVKFGLSKDVSHYLTNILLILGIFLLSYITNLIVKKLLLKYLSKFVKRTKNIWDDIFFQKKVFRFIAHIVPILVIFFSADLFPKQAVLIRKLCRLYISVVFFLILSFVLDSVEAIYRNYDVAKEKPIKGYIQIGKIFLFLIGLITVISQVINQSPWQILSGIGALTAIILLVFKDSILGFVAGVQIAANRLVRIGDWIQMDKYKADGDVIEITLNIIKVQNFDKTITTIPVYALISESFRNWRGMQESGGRRIKRAIHIDIKSIKFCSEQMLDKYAKIARIQEYIQKKRRELQEDRAQKIGDTDAAKLNHRQLTNIGTFRAYATAYLKEHPEINQGMTLMVRQLAPTEHGLPLEFYAFCKDKNWVNYETIQADIFDHLFTAMQEFELEIYQFPSVNNFPSP
ncbi:MAG: mechanosensitive ion channel domain-containing protein [Spirochaetota bacterium]